MKQYEGIVDLILLETHDNDGTAHLSVRFAPPMEWEIPLTEEGFTPWFICVKNANLIKAVKAASDKPVGVTQNGSKYRHIGTFKVSGTSAGRRFFINSMRPTKADYFIEDDEVSLDD